MRVPLVSQNTTQRLPHYQTKLRIPRNNWNFPRKIKGFPQKFQLHLVRGQSILPAQTTVGLFKMGNLSVLSFKDLACKGQAFVVYVVGAWVKQSE